LRYNLGMQLEDEIGDTIAKARAGNGLSIAQLAAAAGLDERDIADMEAYRLTPSEDTAKRLARALGLDEDKVAAFATGSWAPQPATGRFGKLSVWAIHVPFGAYGENAYVAGCPDSSRGAVIDPGGAVSDIERTLHANRLTLDLILITHAHPDHIDGLRELVSLHDGVTVVCSEADREAVMTSIDADWRSAEDGVSFHLGELSVTPLATPGHTAGSTCYVIDGTCFVGDTLFAGSIGRPMHDYRKMLDAIKSKVLSLPEDTVLLPGHGPATTVGEELRHNPFF